MLKGVSHYLSRGDVYQRGRGVCTDPAKPFDTGCDMRNFVTNDYIHDRQAFVVKTGQPLAQPGLHIKASVAQRNVGKIPFLLCCNSAGINIRNSDIVTPVPKHGVEQASSLCELSDLCQISFDSATCTTSKCLYFFTVCCASL